MLANQFIDLLEAEQLLDPESIAELRRQVTQSGNRLPVEALAKLLVDNEQLTKFQASRLVARVKEGGSAKPAKPRGDDLAVLDPDAPHEVDERTGEIIPAAEVLDSLDEPEPDDDFDLPAVGETADGQGRRFRGESPAPGSYGSAAVGGMSATASGIPELKRPVRTVAAASSAPAGRWESARTLGAFALLLTLVIALGILGTWYFRGSASEMLLAAETSYENLDYRRAIERYEGYLSSFPETEDSSFARVRIVLARIRQATENSGDPLEGTRAAEQLLPTVLDEPGLSRVRGELAGALLNIGNRMAQRAEAAKDNAERKKYVDGLEQQLAMIENPQYIASQERRQNEPKIVSLQESHQRLLREIRRTEERGETLAAMKRALESQDAVKAYEVRQVLVRRYPQLQTDAELNGLLSGATDLVKAAVVDAEDRPRLLEGGEAAADQPSGVTARVLLAATSGQPLQLRDPRTLFVQAKESLYGIDAAEGKVRWRRNLDSREMLRPVSVSDEVAGEAATDCVVALPDRGRLVRLAGDTGEPRWSVDFGSRLFPPHVDRDELFVADAGGRVSCLDVASGRVRWSKRLPQPPAAAPGMGKNGQSLFVIGESSNLYSLNRRDGDCTSVFYMAQEPGSIATAPVPIVDRLIVFENIDPRRCQLHVLAIAEESAAVSPTNHDPIELRGNVVVSPEVEGRRMAVATDLGELTVFEMEAVEGQPRLTRMAAVAATERSPRTFWPTLIGNDLWVAANQLTKYQIQAAQQKIIRQWVREDADQFLAAPIRLEDFVVHVRNVRGTEGVRVTAVNAVGDPRWETTLAVPVVGVVRSGDAFDAITSQAALYRIGRPEIDRGRVEGAAANPGRNQREQTFDRVAVGPEGNLAAVNSRRGNQLMYYSTAAGDPQRALTTLQSANGSSPPSGDPVWLPGGVVIPQSDGQLTLVDPATGQTVGTPIQTPLQPGKTVAWTTPAVKADGRTLLAANTDSKLVSVAADGQFSQLKEVPTANPAAAALATVGSVALVPTASQQGSFVEVYDAASLERKRVEAIRGRVLWGLHTAGELAVLYSDVEGLIAMGGEGQRLWTVPLPAAVPVGRPQAIEGHLLIATASGRLLRVDPREGRIVSTLNVGEGVSGSPLVAGGTLLVPGDQGTLIVASAAKFEPYQNEQNEAAAGGGAGE